MTNACDEAFRIVEAVGQDRRSRTRGLDAFSLSLIRCEGQLRRIFTSLVFQASAFERPDVDTLRSALAARSTIYFKHFKIGIPDLVGIGIEELIGDFALLDARLTEATLHRNKLFHGQLTDSSLGTEQLLSMAHDIRTWRERLSDGAQERFGYDGFSGSSFRKRGVDEITGSVDAKITSLADYKAFLANLPSRWKELFGAR